MKRSPNTQQIIVKEPCSYCGVLCRVRVKSQLRKDEVVYWQCYICGYGNKT